MLRNIRLLAIPAVLVAVASVSKPLGAQDPLLLQLHVKSGIRLQADTSGGLVAFGKRSLACNVIPAAGIGARMMWFPCKAAFRAGEIDALGPDRWNENKIGALSFAAGRNTEASGVASVAIGMGNIASADRATALGGYNIVTGQNGFAAGSNNECYATTCVALGFASKAYGYGAVAIGNSNIASGDQSMALGNGANTKHVGAFVWSDPGIIATSSQADNEFRIRARGGVVLRTGGDGTSPLGNNGNTGCDLAAGSGSWGCVSSRYVKENFAEVDGEDVLAKISAMPVTTWNYIAENKAVRHMGPVAQDFYSAFALGTDSASIGMIDINGVNLAAVKALEQRTADLNAAQEQLVEKAKRIDALDERVARLEKALGKKLK